LYCALNRVFETDDEILKVKTCGLKRYNLRCVDSLHNNNNNNNNNNNLSFLSCLSKLESWAQEKEAPRRIIWGKTAKITDALNPSVVTQFCVRTKEIIMYDVTKP
jgi:hypothetical protein